MDKEFLMKLLGTASPSGYEQKAAAIWRKEAKKCAKIVYGDVHGNSIAIKQGNQEASQLRIILAGHIDEIGLMVTTIDKEKGALYFSPVGGWDNTVIIGQRVKIFTKSGKIITGCIGRTPIHLLEQKDRESVPKMENLWIDVGSKENADLVSIGNYAVIDYGAEFLDKNILTGRGIDDRVGAFVVLEVLKNINIEKLKGKKIHAIATVQEEIGMRGAMTSAHSIDPHIGIAVDVTFATDHPSADKKKFDNKLGCGPVITIGPNINPTIFNLLEEIAITNNIPYQLEASPRATGTDANIIQLCRAGVATGLVSIPCRYMHSPCEIIDMQDVENTIKLITLFCESKIIKDDLIVNEEQE